MVCHQNCTGDRGVCGSDGLFRDYVADKGLSRNNVLIVCMVFSGEPVKNQAHSVLDIRWKNLILKGKEHETA